MFCKQEQTVENTSVTEQFHRSTVSECSNVLAVWGFGLRVHSKSDSRLTQPIKNSFINAK